MGLKIINKMWTGYLRIGISVVLLQIRQRTLHKMLGICRVDEQFLAFQGRHSRQHVTQTHHYLHKPCGKKWYEDTFNSNARNGYFRLLKYWYTFAACGRDATIGRCQSVRLIGFVDYRHLAVGVTCCVHFLCTPIHELISLPSRDLCQRKSKVVLSLCLRTTP